MFTTFITEYWLEVLFGLIATVAGIIAKKFYNLFKDEKQRLKEDSEEALKKDIHDDFRKEVEESRRLSDERYNSTKKDIEGLDVEIDALRQGILSIQGKGFKQSCMNLLKEDHEITSDEWERINLEHDVYKGLGGNHEGDRLYEDVVVKHRKNL